MYKKVHLHLNEDENKMLNEIQKNNNYNNIQTTKLIKNIIYDYYYSIKNENKIVFELNKIKNILLKQNKQIEQNLKSNNDENNNSKESITDKEVLTLNKNLFDYYIKNNELSDRQISLWYKHYNDKLEMVDDTYGI